MRGLLSYMYIFYIMKLRVQTYLVSYNIILEEPWGFPGVT